MDNQSPAVPEEVQEGQGESPQTVPSEGGENVSKALELERLNAELGTHYKSFDDAIKGIKETRSYVGAKKEKIATEAVSNGDFVPRSQYEKDMFYMQHPELQPYRDIIDARSSALGQPITEVLAGDATLKTTLEKLQNFDKSEKEKSVLMTSNRLGETKDKIDESRQALEKGDYQSANKAAVGSVMELLKSQ
jgi:hypothetical protein